MIRTIGSLCSGIGGLDLGIEWATGAETLWQVEINDYARAILERHWPNAVQYTDVRNVGKRNLPPVDLICAGPSCQPHSVAGKRRGRSDERWLFDEILRVVRELEPDYVLFENVLGLLSSDDGEALREVLRSLAECGRDAVWFVLGADSVGAPHKRKRIFVFSWKRGLVDAERGSVQRRGGSARFHGSEGASEPPHGGTQQAGRTAGSPGQDRGAWRRLAHGDRAGLEGRRLSRRGCADEGPARSSGSARTEGRAGSAQSRVGRAVDGLPRRLDAPRWPGRRGVPQHAWEAPRTKKGVKFRRERLTALGNAVVPEQAYQAMLVCMQIIKELEKR